MSSSYADAAASSGPAKVEKIPEPTKVERTSDPHGSVETIDGKEFEKQKKAAAAEAKKAASEASRIGKEQAEYIKEEIDELKKESTPYVEKAVAVVKEKYAAVASFLSSKFNTETANEVATELQNPVVLSQLAVIFGGAAAGYSIYTERGHIRSDNKYVVAIHAGIITALVLGDVYVFQKLYPKYKKN